MSEHFEQLSALLQSLPIDTTYEQSLLNASCSDGNTDTFLVTGAQDAMLFSLLSLDEPLFEASEAPLFPVFVEFGDALNLRVVNHNDEVERYQSVQDFRHYCANRLAEVRKCTLSMPVPLFKRCQLRFHLLANTDFTQLNSIGAGCTGCIVVASADAGGFSDDYATLFDWLTKERCISGKTSLILTQRAPRKNLQLPRMAESMLGREKVATFYCSGRSKTALLPSVALDNASRDLLDRKETKTDFAVIETCCRHVSNKFEKELDAVRKQEANYKEKYEAYCKAETGFHAEAVTAGYGLSHLLTEQESENLRAEIRGMFTSLKAALPDMLNEVLEESANTKEDLKQLAGDYLGSLINAYTSALLTEVTDKMLIPRSNEQFHSVFQRFRRMMQMVNLEYETDIAHIEAAFLRMSDVNMGDYHTSTASTISGTISIAAESVTNGLIARAFGFLGYLFLNKTIDRFFNAVSTTLENVIDDAMPKKMYVNKLQEDLLKQLDNAEEDLCNQLDKNVLPRLHDLLQTEYRNLTQAYEQRLQDQAASYLKQQQEAAKKAALFRESIERLNKFCTSAMH